MPVVPKKLVSLKMYRSARKPDKSPYHSLLERKISNLEIDTKSRPYGVKID